MSNTAIKAENLSKQYRLGQVGRATLHNDLNRLLYKIVGKDDPYLKIGEQNDRAVKSESAYAWALQDINFEVHQGEVLGIIGKNGAGKSTLLKILSKVTAPTTGIVKIKGRIASLLEVGTGFHPELSGRDNIYLNGAILGMRKREITNKLDEIVAFAGVERYLDTPVKRYSSGMYVRLAFAVAAHLEPDILIVDEVLAVGDAEFQKKCLGKMKDVSEKDGRTVLFVSHNMQAVSAITNRCMLLKNGRLIMSGLTDKIISEYYSENLLLSFELRASALSEEEPRIIKVAINSTYENNLQAFNERFEIVFDIYTPKPVKAAAISYQIFNSSNESVLHILNLNAENEFCNTKGIYTLTSIIPKLKLYPDKYYLTVHFADNYSKKKFQTIEGICSFEVKVFGEMRDYYWYQKKAVYVEESEWKISYSD